MSQRRPKRYVSVAEYLAGELESALRHEYVQGEVYAFAGASDRHNRIALNIASRLNAHLESDSCEVFMSNMKVRVSADVFYYPDVVVTCDPPGGDAYFRAAPRLIVEVISPTTERLDRHEKMLAYKGVRSLQEYVLVMQDAMMVEIHRRREKQWKVETLGGAQEVLRLTSLNLGLTLGEVYRNVRLPELTADEGS